VVCGILHGIFSLKKNGVSFHQLHESSSTKITAFVIVIVIVIVMIVVVE